MDMFLSTFMMVQDDQSVGFALTFSWQAGQNVELDKVLAKAIKKDGMYLVNVLAC